MKAILSRWSIMRILRFVLGAIALVQSIVQRDIIFGIVAGFLVLTAIANVGCCGSNGCTVNFSNRKKESEVVYEELDNKK